MLNACATRGQDADRRVAGAASVVQVGVQLRHRGASGPVAIRYQASGRRRWQVRHHGGAASATGHGSPVGAATSNVRPAALPTVRRHRSAGRLPAAVTASSVTASGAQPRRASSNTTAPHNGTSPTSARTVSGFGRFLLGFRRRRQPFRSQRGTRRTPSAAGSASRRRAGGIAGSGRLAGARFPAALGRRLDTNFYQHRGGAGTTLYHAAGGAPIPCFNQAVRRRRK